MKILVLAPHPFFQARGTPLAVRTVLEFLSARGHEVDVLTLHEGEDVDIPNCRIHRIPPLPGVHNVRPGFSLKKVVCDAVMFCECLRMVRRNRYDLDSRGRGGGVHRRRGPSGLRRALHLRHGLLARGADGRGLPDPRISRCRCMRYCESVAVRRSLGVLTVCAALEDVALRPRPGQAGGPGGGQHAAPPPGRRRGNGEGAVCRKRCSREGPVAMYVGNLERYQGIDLLLEGFRHTLRRVPSASLVIVGGREEDIRRYRDMADGLGILPRVHFLGPRPLALLPGCCARPTCWCRPGSRGSTRR